MNAASRSAADIDTDGHGTMVASVIAANKNNAGMHGIAFEAQVLAIRADTPGNCQRTGPDENCSFSDPSLINAIAQGETAVWLSLRHAWRG